MFPLSTRLAGGFFFPILSAAVQIGQSFAATLQARDLGNNLVTSFNSSVALTTFTPGQSPTLLITEVEAITTKRVQLSNVSTNPLDVNGWRVLFYDASSWPAPKVWL